MRKIITLTYAVALLLGLVSTQALTGGVGTGALPAYATYQGQANINNKFASQYGINTTEMSALNGGFGQPGVGAGGLPGFDSFGVWNSPAKAAGGAVSLQAVSATPVATP